MSTLELITVPLTPFGNRFQPTGFPELGAAEYQRPVGDEKEVTQSLHVESPQSCANHLEATLWDSSSKDQIELLAGLPYVRVVHKDGGFVTSSRLEPHRLASAYLKEGVFECAEKGENGEKTLARLLGATKGESRGMDNYQVYREAFRLDPLTLVHGAMFAIGSWSWQPKISRALTMFIEAEDVQAAYSGGVKTDPYDSTGGDSETSGSESGYGSVPHSRTEYVARKVAAYIAIDHGQLESYGLGDAATHLLKLLIELELATFFQDGQLRLRTACIFTVGQCDQIRRRDEVAKEIPAAIAACKDLFNDEPITTVVWSGRSSKGKK